MCASVGLIDDVPSGRQASQAFRTRHLGCRACLVRRRLASGASPVESPSSGVASVRVLPQTREGVPFAAAPGVTLVVSPELVASGMPAAPLIERLRTLLPDILENDKGENS